MFSWDNFSVQACPKVRVYIWNAHLTWCLSFSSSQIWQLSLSHSGHISKHHSDLCLAASGTTPLKLGKHRTTYSHCQEQETFSFHLTFCLNNSKNRKQTKGRKSDLNTCIWGIHISMKITKTLRQTEVYTSFWTQEGEVDNSQVDEKKQMFTK